MYGGGGHRREKRMAGEGEAEAEATTEEGGGGGTMVIRGRILFKQNVEDRAGGAGKEVEGEGEGKMKDSQVGAEELAAKVDEAKAGAEAARRVEDRQIKVKEPVAEWEGAGWNTEDGENDVESGANFFEDEKDWNLEDRQAAVDKAVEDGFAEAVAEAGWNMEDEEGAAKWEGEADWNIGDRLAASPEVEDQPGQEKLQRTQKPKESVMKKMGGFEREAEVKSSVVRERQANVAGEGEGEGEVAAVTKAADAGQQGGKDALFGKTTVAGKENTVRTEAGEGPDSAEEKLKETQKPKKPTGEAGEGAQNSGTGEGEAEKTLPPSPSPPAPQAPPQEPQQQAIPPPPPDVQAKPPSGPQGQGAAPASPPGKEEHHSPVPQSTPANAARPISPLHIHSSVRQSQQTEKSTEGGVTLQMDLGSKRPPVASLAPPANLAEESTVGGGHPHTGVGSHRPSLIPSANAANPVSPISPVPLPSKRQSLQAEGSTVGGVTLQMDLRSKRPPPVASSHPTPTPSKLPSLPGHGKSTVQAEGGAGAITKPQANSIYALTTKRPPRTELVVSRGHPSTSTQKESGMSVQQHKVSQGTVQHPQTPLQETLPPHRPQNTSSEQLRTPPPQQPHQGEGEPLGTPIPPKVVLKPETEADLRPEPQDVPDPGSFPPDTAAEGGGEGEGEGGGGGEGDDTSLVESHQQFFADAREEEAAAAAVGGFKHVKMGLEEERLKVMPTDRMNNTLKCSRKMIKK